MRQCMAAGHARSGVYGTSDVMPTQHRGAGGEAMILQKRSKTYVAHSQTAQPSKTLTSRVMSIAVPTVRLLEI